MISGPQQAQGVGERREREAGHELLGDRGAADEVALLEHQRAQAGLGEVAGVVSPLWPPPTTIASYARLVELVETHALAVFLAGLNRGSFAVRAGTVVLWW